ncbi:penicillin-binding protein 2 [Lactobacillus sp. S2-2]|nr:penicillin-binding protein 2 [Lactobacillus sp. S2-2]
MQIFKGNEYKAIVNQSDNTVKYGNAQRGLIYDSTGKVLVGNQTNRAITYTKSLNTMPSEMYQSANELSNYISMDLDTLTRRQLADYYLTNSNNLTKVENKLTNVSANDSVDDKYNKALEYIQNNKSIKFSKKTKTAATIFAKMSGAYQLSTTYIKSSDVSNKEIAEVGEHLNDIKGVQVGTSWSRNYPYGKSIQSILGTVSSERAGLPSDRINELITKGYSRSDSVGQSFLERQYESVLKGTKSQTEVQTGGTDNLVKETKKYAGKKGDNLQLTINSKFQKKLQSLVTNSMKGGVGNSTGAYAVVMNPKTGGVIGMGGVKRNPETGKLINDELGTMNSSITMGSVVKGATVSGALMDNVITPNNSTLLDRPIKSAGLNKSSWFNHSGNANISVNAEGALEVSSNSYMMQLAMKEAKLNYPSQSIGSMNPDIFNIERGYFNQFGLGVKTGIDLPGETTGITGVGTASNLGNALDLSFGNYDSYTTLQIAQYISTIANNGNRMKPYLVQNIRSSNNKGKLGKIESTTTPTLLNRIPMTQEQKNVVKRGMYQVVHGSNRYKTGGMLSSIKPEVSAKTGTAQTFYNGKQTVTLSLVSFAPSKNPKVAIALAIPNLPTDAESNNMTLAKQIYSAYWKYVEAKPNNK